jgi:hypothetical protein
VAHLIARASRYRAALPPGDWPPSRQAAGGAGHQCPPRTASTLKLAPHPAGDQHLDLLLYSAHDFGQPKEQPALWPALRAVLTPFDPARTLLIDDNESVLRSAQQFGIRHLITIAQPDSQQPPRDGLAFPAIEQFSALW